MVSQVFRAPIVGCCARTVIPLGRGNTRLLVTVRDGSAAAFANHTHAFSTIDMPPTHTRCLPNAKSCAALTILLCAGTQAQEPNARGAPIRAELGFERVTLPGGEHMGLVGGSVLFPVADRWWAGPAVYGAATGQRGGLFVGGAELKREWELPWGFELGTGIYAGGGGGAAAPVGSGLMLRGALTLSRDLGPLRAGLTWSHVRFPSGDIQ